MITSSVSSSYKVDNSTYSLFHIFSLVFSGTMECNEIAAEIKPDLAASLWAVNKDIVCLLIPSKWRSLRRIWGDIVYICYHRRNLTFIWQLICETRNLRMLMPKRPAAHKLPIKALITVLVIFSVSTFTSILEFETLCITFPVFISNVTKLSVCIILPALALSEL